MKNLYKLLKPKVKTRLLAEREKYEIVDKVIIPTLKNNHVYTDLKISDVNRLIVFSNTYTFDWTVHDYKWGTKLFKEQ
jgi:hypothetical protein